MAKIKSDYNCSLQLTFDLLGGKWKLRILWHIMQGHNRFSLLQKGIPEITQKMLTTQLHELEESRLIIRRVIREKPLHIEYALSATYPDLANIIDRLCDFSKDYASINSITIRDND
jgi:DNA-binding HxlR family transcriptional regulator